MALIVVAGSFAWACTPQAHMQIIPPAFGPAGTQVAVTGGTAYGSAPVEVRWNSPDGPVLASVQSLTATQGVFHAQVTIPVVSPDVYYLVAVVQGRGVARAAYEVTTAEDSAEQTSAAGTPPAKGVSNDLWSGLAASTGAYPASTGAYPAQAGAALSQAPASKGLMAGMGLLALGTMALTAGAVLAFGRKRTAQATR